MVVYDALKVYVVINTIFLPNTVSAPTGVPANLAALKSSGVYKPNPIICKVVIHLKLSLPMSEVTVGVYK